MLDGRPDDSIYWYNQHWYDYTGTVAADMAGDATRLRQVLLNLLGNALKFTSHGGSSFACGRRRGGGSDCGSTSPTPGPASTPSFAPACFRSSGG